jgi:predicted NAD/FAD-dependent oxidoreductase
MASVHVAVIGAGIAGLACAREIARADARVTVFEKSRGLGGRLGTRRGSPPAAPVHPARSRRS